MTAGLALLAALTSARASRAQPGGAVRQPAADPAAAPAPPPPPAITPPVVTKDEGAKYPEQAIADKVLDRAEVVLVLELDATGAVRNATVETPVGRTSASGS